MCSTRRRKRRVQGRSTNQVHLDWETTRHETYAWMQIRNLILSFNYPCLPHTKILARVPVSYIFWDAYQNLGLPSHQTLNCHMTPSTKTNATTNHTWNPCQRQQHFQVKSHIKPLHRWPPTTNSQYYMHGCSEPTCKALSCMFHSMMWWAWRKTAWALDLACTFRFFSTEFEGMQDEQKADSNQVQGLRPANTS